MKILCKIKHGSHLYGTNTPASDLDYKGVYLPTFDQVIRGDFKDEIDLSTNKSSTKNTKDDVDEQYISLQKFLKMAYSGETIALDMLHANGECTLVTSPEWEFIQANRSKFYTQSMKSFLGYCKRQAAKYGIKGSRIDVIEQVKNYLLTVQKRHGESVKLNQDPLTMMGLEGIALANTKTGHVQVVDHFYKNDKRVDKVMLVVCESKYEFTMKVSDVIISLDKKLKGYGNRAQLARENNGVDWKAISHAFRAGYQLQEIYTTGDLVFPLAEREFVLAIKQGKLPFNDVQVQLEELIESVEKLAFASTFPEQADREFFEKYLTNLYRSMANDY
jgi:predicted nucleotidyltransferase